MSRSSCSVATPRHAGIPAGRPWCSDDMICSSVPPYFHSSSRRLGPIAPPARPPWQP
jgi:hypothetical protein